MVSSSAINHQRIPSNTLDDAVDYLVGKGVICVEHKKRVMDKVTGTIRCGGRVDLTRALGIEFHDEIVNERTVDGEAAATRISALLDGMNGMIGLHKSQTELMVRSIINTINSFYDLPRKDLHAKISCGSAETQKSRLYLEHLLNSSPVVQLWFDRIYLRNKEKMDKLFKKEVLDYYSDETSYINSDPGILSDWEHEVYRDIIGFIERTIKLSRDFPTTRAGRDAERWHKEDCAA